jgi:hypothetical protein
VLNDFKQDIDWKNIQTKNNYNARVLFSVINKELRRGQLLNSLAVAKELFDSGEQFQNKLWQRLITITAEDVGLGNLGLYSYVCSSYEHFLKDYSFNIIYECVRLICGSKKNRFADEVLNFVLLKYVASNRDYFNESSKDVALNGETREHLQDFLKTRDLINSVKCFVSLAMSGNNFEETAWGALEDVMTVWETHIKQAYQMTLRMKPGKNDRLMAGVLHICGFVMDIVLDESEASVGNDKPMDLPRIFIPAHALDLHANTTGHGLTVEDFRRFWTEGSVLSNEVSLGDNPLYSKEYKDYILDNLDSFLEFYYFRKDIKFNV